MPTLNAAEESALLNELMATNAGCELPCWWGITPGQTPAQQARDMFIKSGANRWRDTFDGTYRQIQLGHRTETQDYYPFDIAVRMYERSGIVELIVVSSLHQPLDESERFVTEWARYDLREVLARLGPPSDLRLYVPPNPAELGYELYLIYEQLGIQVVYRVPGNHLGELRYELCFTLNDLLFIEIALFPPGMHGLIDELTVLNVAALPTWEAVTGQGSNAFMDRFAGGSSYCILVQWPER
jgi:hypothetical protein